MASNTASVPLMNRPSVVTKCPYCGSVWLGGLWGDVRFYCCADCHGIVPRDLIGIVQEMLSGS